MSLLRIIVTLFSENIKYKPTMGAGKIYRMLVLLASTPLLTSSSLTAGPPDSWTSSSLTAAPTSRGSSSFWDEDDDSSGVLLEVSY